MRLDSLEHWQEMSRAGISWILHRIFMLWRDLAVANVSLNISAGKFQSAGIAGLRTLASQNEFSRRPQMTRPAMIGCDDQQPHLLTTPEDR
jgi:hypothetical protein